MKTSKLLIVVAALTALLIVSLFVVGFYIMNITNKPSNADTDSYLLQYEWPQFQSDPSSTHFSAGPAPEAPDFLWKTNITGVQSYVTAFNGKVFVTKKLRFSLLTGKQAASCGTPLCLLLDPSRQCTKSMVLIWLWETAALT